MKRNFFKKLSFVLASAMVLTTLAPASGALAAGGLKLNSKTKYLHLGRVEEGQNEFNFNINGTKAKGWKYEWTSANAKVAKVNAKNGVTTATGVGSTKVSVVIADKDGEEIEKLTATVTVRDNIETVKISNLPTEALTVGEEYDFNRSYVTESGSSKKTSGVTRWVVTPDTATIDDKGVFVATAAGEYTITANSFQSTAKYKEWLADGTDHVTATTSEKVVVAPSIVEIDQLSATKFTVEFDSAVKDAVGSKIEVTNEAGMLQIVKEVKWDATGKVATVELYISLADGVNYTVKALDTQKAFVASVGAPAVVEITGPALVEYGVPKELKYKLLDKNGVEVAGTAGGSVSFENTNNVGWVDGNFVTLFNVGDVAGVKATYYTNTYDMETGNENTLESVVYQVKAVKSLAAVTSGLKAWTISDAATPGAADYDNVNHVISLSDTSKTYRIHAKGEDSNGDPVYFTKFSSTNPAKLIVNSDGTIYPVAVGSVNVLIETEDGYKDVLLVNVQAERAASYVSLKGANSITLSNALLADEAVFEIEVKDQWQNVLPAKAVTVEQYAQPTGGDAGLVADVSVNGKVVFTPVLKVSGDKAPAGTYRFKLSTQDKTVIVSVIVREPAATASYTKITVSNTTLDQAVATNAASLPKLTIYVRTYDNTGVANGVVTNQALRIEGPDKYDQTFTTDPNGEIDFAAVTGVNPLVPSVNGTYKITGSKGGTNFVTTYFTLTNSQAAPTVKTEKITLTVNRTEDIAAKILSELVFTTTSNTDGSTVLITGVDVVSAGIDTATNSFANAGTYSVLVKTVKVSETLGAIGTLVHDVTVNTVITVTVN